MSTMDDMRQAWAGLNSDPRFRALGYEEQQKVRAQWATVNLPRVPEYTRMGPAAQSMAFQSMVTAAPALVNTSEYAQRALQVAQTIRTGGTGPEDYLSAIETAAETHVNRGMTDSTGIFGRISRWAMGKGLETARQEERADTMLFTMRMPDKVNDPDDYKAQRYMMQAAESNASDASGTMRFMMNMAPAIGTILNVVSAKAAGGATVKAAAGMGKVAAASRNYRFTTWLTERLIPSAVDWTFDASFLTFADVMAHKVEENSRLGMRTESENQLAKIAVNFGSNFVLDAVMFSAMNIVGLTARAAFKVFRPRGMHGPRTGPVDTEDLARMTADIVSGAQVNRAQFLSYPKEVQDGLVKLRNRFAALANLDTAKQSDVIAGLIHRQGYDLVQEAGAYKLRALAGGAARNVPGSFTTPQKALAGLFDFQHAAPDTVASAMEAVVTGNLSLQKSLRAKLKGLAPRLDIDTVANTLVPDHAGRLHAGAIETATRSVLREVSGGVETAVGTKLKVKQVAAEAYWKMADSARVSDMQIFVPDTLRTADEASRFLNRYWVDVASLAPDGARTSLRHLTDVVDAVPHLATGSNPLFVEATAKANGIAFHRRADGLFQVGDEVASTIAEASDKLAIQMLLESPNSIRESFKQMRFSFVEKDGMWSVRAPGMEKGGNLLTGQHSSIESAATELVEKGFIPRPSQARAANIILDPTGKNIEMVGGAISGPPEFMRDYAARYFDNVTESKVLYKMGSNSVQEGSFTNVFRAVSPEFGFTREFGSLEAAQKYLTKRFTSLDELRELGLMKGVLDIRPTQGRIVARELGGKNHAFRSVGELRDWLRAKAPDPTWQKEIANIDRSIIDTVVDSLPPEMREVYGIRPGVPRAANFEGILEYVQEHPQWKLLDRSNQVNRLEAAGTSLRHHLQALKDNFQTPTAQRMRRMVGQEGIEAIGDVSESMEKAGRNARGLTSQVAELIDTIPKFKGAPGRKRRAVLTAFLQAPEDTWDAVAKTHNTVLSGADREFMQRFRMVSDGLGKMFGIDPYKLIQNYLPRLQEFISDPRNLDGVTTAGDIIKRTDFAHAKEMAFFSEYMRADELVSFIHEADPMQMLAKYAQKGVKNLTLGKVYNEQVAIWNQLAASGALGTEGGRAAHTTMMHYMEEMMGMYTDEASKLARHAARETANVFARLTKAGKATPAVHDWIHTMHEFTIASTMSFRPWPVIRNMMQPWMTLAPMYGNDAILKVMGQMGDDKWLAATAKRLRDSGRLMKGIPLYGATFEASTRMGKLNKLGMYAYTNSDDYTRIMVDGVVRDSFTDAVAKYTAGTLGEGQSAYKKFIRLANLHRVDDFDQRKIVGLLKDKGFESAMDYYGDVVTRETMFAYTAGSNPPMFKGMWGRLFGGFGHWPVYYVQTLLNGLRRGNAMDKVLFAGRVATNSAILWTTFDQVLGIRADNFVPWKTMFFEGGPYYQLLNKALRTAAGSPGMSWKTVRQDAARLMGPGVSGAAAVAQGLKMMEQGQTYQGYLRLWSVPLAPDR